MTTIIGIAAAYFSAAFVAAALPDRLFKIGQPGGRATCIDGLRGYLALSVMIHHFVIWIGVSKFGQPWVAPSSAFLNQLGACSVSLFFMATGFVFYPRVLIGFQKNCWTEIYVSRIFRIMPMVLISVLLVLSVLAYRGGSEWNWQQLYAALRWITGWSEPPLLGVPESGRVNAYVLWSLWYEWVFYVAVLPISALLADVIRGRITSLVIPVAIAGCAFLGERMGLEAPVLRYLPFFAVGMLGHELQSRRSVRRLLVSPTFGFASMAGLVSAAFLFHDPYSKGLLLISPFFFAIAAGNSFFGLFDSRGALVLGECSFSIYLLHGILLSLCFVELAPLSQALTAAAMPLLLPLVVLLIVPSAATTFLVVERPMIAVGRRLARQRALVHRPCSALIESTPKL